MPVLSTVRLCLSWLLGLALAITAQAAPQPPAALPAIVLVHGAFADASSWNAVIERLQAANMQVIAPPNPLRGPAFDSAYVASFLSQISGPVLLVGHSYGGAVITNAASEAPNVTGLVYVCAFVPDEGERLQELAAA